MLYIKYYSILFARAGTYFPEGGNDSFAIIADIITKEIYVQRRSCRKAFMCVHQGSTFQIEILAISRLGYPIDQPFLEVSCQDRLV